MSRFSNSSGANGQPFRRVPRMLLTQRAAWPRNVPVNQRRPPAPANDDEVLVTFIGHSTFLLQSACANILIDPVYSERASPVQWAGPRRVRAPGVAFDDLPPIAMVLVSHNHYDHCDLRTLRALEQRFSPVFVTPLGNDALLRSAGARRIDTVDWWGNLSAASVAVTCTPAQHFSARHPFNRNTMLWGGFVIRIGDRRIYFAGDTGYGPHFREIRERVGAIDLALLPIGAYEPRWFMQEIHMNPAEAVRAHLEVGARQSLAMHFGTFQLTPEAIDDPARALDEALRAANVPANQFRVPETGDTLRLATD